MESTKIIENSQPLPKPAPRRFQQAMAKLPEGPSVARILKVARIVEEIEKKSGLKPSVVHQMKTNNNIQPLKPTRTAPQIVGPPPIPQTPTSPEPIYDLPIKQLNMPPHKVAPKPEDLLVLQKFFGLTTPLCVEAARRMACSSTIEGLTPLHQAARGNQPLVVAALLRMGAPVEAQDKWGYRAVHKAAAAGSVEVLQLLKSYGADLQALGNSGYRPLHRAAVNGAMEAVQWLVEQGTPVDTTISGGWTALHLAVWWDREGVVRCLLRLGARVNYLNNSGHSALQLAIAGQYHDLVRHLVSYGGVIEQ